MQAVVKPEEVATIPLNQKIIYFKAECDFTNKKDTANFFYSLMAKLDSIGYTTKNGLYHSTFYGLPVCII